MEVKWYVVDQWNNVIGPYKSKTNAEEFVAEECVKNKPYGISWDAHENSFTIFPQIEKE